MSGKTDNGTKAGASTPENEGANVSNKETELALKKREENIAIKESELKTREDSIVEKESELKKREEDIEEREAIAADLIIKSHNALRPVEEEGETVLAVKDGEERVFPLQAWNNLGSNKNGWERKVVTPIEAQ